MITLLVQIVGNKVLVWPQNHIAIPDHSLPQPDASLLNWRGDFYGLKRPMPKDVLLAVEVAETSAQYDRDVKGPLYAEAGIPEYWIVNLQENVIEVYTEPSGGAYKGTKQAGRGDTLALPGEFGVVEVGDILGGGVG